jgi:hypothetical protein
MRSNTTFVSLLLSASLVGAFITGCRAPSSLKSAVSNSDSVSKRKDSVCKFVTFLNKPDRTELTYQDCNGYLITINCKHASFQDVFYEILLQSKLPYLFYESELSLFTKKITLSLNKVPLCVAFQAAIDKEGDTRIVLIRQD